MSFRSRTDVHLREIVVVVCCVARSLYACERAINLRDEMSKVDTRSARLETPSSSKQENPLPLNSGVSGPKQETSNGGNALSVEDRLKRLDDLKKKGLLSPQEYKKRKAEIVKDL